MTGPFAAAVAVVAPTILGGPLFFGPLTPILRFLIPLILLVVVIYVLYKVLT